MNAEEEWVEILLPYLPILRQIGEEIHENYHSTGTDELKKNNYGYFTCK